uniref:Uncharacterized protein n=1 Tax=viral metagenome TaxID=1070528 RepID=A0A6H1Z8A1_9ZZZZ
MKRKGRYFIDPIYQAEVYYLLGGTAAELREYFIKEHGQTPKFKDNTGGLEWMAEDKKGMRFYVWLEKFNQNNLVHEIKHLTNDVLNEIGIPPCEQTEEAYAYLQEFYFRTLMDLTHKMRK